MKLLYRTQYCSFGTRNLFSHDTRNLYGNYLNLYGFETIQLQIFEHNRKIQFATLRTCFAVSQSNIIKTACAHLHGTSAAVIKANIILNLTVYTFLLIDVRESTKSALGVMRPKSFLFMSSIRH